jgi:hypothetical protein
MRRGRSGNWSGAWTWRACTPGSSAAKKKVGGPPTIRGCSSVCGFTPTVRASDRCGNWRGRSEWEPALQWLMGCDAVNYHTLSSFRVEYREE